jgi:hypothetical protein
MQKNKNALLASIPDLFLEGFDNFFLFRLSARD